MIIDGKQIAAKVRGEVAQAVIELRAKGIHPGLTVVRVGEDPASAIYVRGKRKDCEEVGKRAIVVGRSNIVGKPMVAMLLERHATVTIAHSRTQDLAAEVARADIVVAAIGKAELVKGAWIKQGAVVVDGGMYRINDGRLVWDVEYSEASKRASAITPVPGGVGPMTRAMLLVNTVELARHAAR